MRAPEPARRALGSGRHCRYLEERFARALIVERTPADIEADVRAAAPPGTVAGLDITADATGLTLFATVRRR